MGPYDIITKIYQTLLARTTVNFSVIPTDPAEFPRTLPFLCIHPAQTSDTEDSAQSGTDWKFNIDAGWSTNYAERREAWLHADANLKGSLHWAIKKLPEWLIDDMVVMLDSDFSFELQNYQNTPNGAWVLRRTVSVEIPEHEREQAVVAVADNALFPPALGATMHDVWGIAVDEENKRLYLTQGNADTLAAAAIHVYDLTTNQETTSLTAGAVAGQFRRGLEYANGHLFLIDDQTTRGTWTLLKIDVSTDTIVASADLGSGEFTGVSAYGDNKEWITVSAREGAGTNYRVYAASDLTRHQDEEDTTIQPGYVAGMIDIGDYYYDIVGSTAFAYGPDGRMEEFDIFLGGFRVQWRGATRWGSIMWVAGIRFTSEGQIGIIQPFAIPSQITEALG